MIWDFIIWNFLMFIMTADIKIGQFAPVKPTAVQWQHSVDSYADTATITLPALCRVVREGEVYSQVNTAQQFTEGMPVQVWAGYNGNNPLVFDGFVSRIKYSVPLVVECEGYSYLIRRKVFAASYPATTVRQILTDLVAGTPITISPLTADVAIPAVRFDNRTTGDQVLEFVKKNGLAVFFKGSELYAGIEQHPQLAKGSEPPTAIPYRLNWNTIGDDGLSFGPYTGTVVNIRAEKKNTDGSKKRGGLVAPGVKVKTVTLDYTQEQLDKVSAEETAKLQQKGFEGTLTTFLQPIAQKGMAADITDARYPERSGKYFIEQVSGSFSTSGGRLTLKLGRRL